MQAVNSRCGAVFCRSQRLEHLTFSVVKISEPENLELKYIQCKLLIAGAGQASADHSRVTDRHTVCGGYGGLLVRAWSEDGASEGPHCALL